jgi:ABC-type oligopeptide transport system ATPase subunit
MKESPPAVEVRELRKEFRRKDKKAGRFARRRVPALDGVTFTIARGECVAVLGQNRPGTRFKQRRRGALTPPCV